MKRIIVFLAVASALVLIATSSRAAELITNGGFETGNFTGWTATNAANPYRLWTVSGAGGGGGFTPVPVASSPPRGIDDAWEGTASNANSPFTLDQQFTIPSGATASITWRHRLQVNLNDFCGHPGFIACGTVTYTVEILNTSNVVLQTLFTKVAPGLQYTDTGWQFNLRSLNAFAGQTIKIRFKTLSTVTFDGPGQLEVEDVSVQTPAIVTAATASIAGQLTTSDGRPISGGMVTLTDGPVTRIAISNPFGYYRFDDVATGRTYVIGAGSKRYFFPNSPIAMTIGGDLLDLNFLASP
jgi:hypothetical protein